MRKPCLQNLGTMTALLLLLWMLAGQTVQKQTSDRVAFVLLCASGVPSRFLDLFFYELSCTATFTTPTKADVSWMCRLMTGDSSFDTFSEGKQECVKEFITSVKLRSEFYDHTASPMMIHGPHRDAKV